MDVQQNFKSRMKILPFSGGAEREKGLSIGSEERRGINITKYCMKSH